MPAKRAPKSPPPPPQAWHAPDPAERLEAVGGLDLRRAALGRPPAYETRLTPVGKGAAAASIAFPFWWMSLGRLRERENTSQNQSLKYNIQASQGKPP